MLLKQDEYQRIIRIAHIDLCDFFEHSVMQQPDWSNMKSDLEKQFGRSLSDNGHIKLAKLIELVSSTAETHVPVRGSFKDALHFIRRWMQQFLRYGAGPYGAGPSFEPSFLGLLLWEFKNFIGQTRLIDKFDISWHKRGASEVHFNGVSISWIVYIQNTKLFSVVYDSARIEMDTSDRKTILERYVKMFLYNIGHIRLHHQWIIQQCETLQSTGYILTPAVHEAESWLYAEGIRMFLISSIACLDRVLGFPDTAWRF